MIQYEKYKLKNGLTVILHKDKTTPIAVVNTIFNVGARDESENRTGFAHLFEHLMFGGSKHISNFDAPLQKAGGECNAFTNNDITNYYNTLPIENLETALWLESDRLLSLAFTPKSLEVQRDVVIEEFKQRYLNQPYGDVWLVLRPLVFTKHPYKWATIGKEIEHVSNATMAEVKDFFKKYYTPQNAVLAIGGNIDINLTKKLIDKWYADIPAGNKYNRSIEKEPLQNEYRTKTIKREVPANTIYIVFRIGDRNSKDHFLGDLTSDILSGSKSSRLYQKLVKEKSIFTSIQSFISSGWEHGMFIISGNLSKNITFEEAENEIKKELDSLKLTDIEALELNKVKNKLETAQAFQDQSVLNRVMNLCQYELLGDIERINTEKNNYNSITSQEIKAFSSSVFNSQNTSVLKVEKT